MRHPVLETIVSVLLLATAVSAQATAPAGDSAETISIPGGTTVVLRNLESLTSKTAKKGEEVKFRVVKPVVVDGVVVIATGATATARVTHAVPAQRKGVGGLLQLSFEKVELVTGATAPIRAFNMQEAGGKRQMVGNMIQAGMLTAGLAAPLLLMQKGQEVEIRRGERFEALIASEITLARAEALAHQQAPPSPRADGATLYFIKAPPAAGQIEVDAAWPFCIGEARYHLARNSTLVVEVPPGKYWIHTLYKSLRKVKPQDLTEVDAAAGKAYYFEYAIGDRKLIFRPLEADAAQKLMENSEVYAEIKMEEHPPQRLQDMKAQAK